MAMAEDRSLLRLFAEVMPEGQWLELEGPGKRAQIYTLRVVVGLMLLQRLNDRGSQQAVVEQMAAGGWDGWLPDCKRVRKGKISLNTGAYARACGRTSLEVIEKVCDQLLAELGKRIEPDPELKVPLLLLDGSSLQLEHVPGLLEDFPPGHNQHGEGHWGIAKWVALHDMQTGVALRPAWGAMYGTEAVSEQQLARDVLQRAPAGSVIVGDRNFGVFAFAYAVIQSNHQVLFRLNKLQARALGAGELLPTGERKVVWRPSRYERGKYPELPPDAQIQGRLIVVTRPGFREPLYLFTTLQESPEKIVAWYAQRWNLELDLRTLKGTMRLQHLRGKSTEAVEKELLIAVVAYGLVRAFMALAARRVELHPRRLSFTRAYNLLDLMIGKLCMSQASEREKAYDRILDYIGQSKLPQRSKPRAYPREVWGSGKYFPRRGSSSKNAQSK
jgi:hypothetical protein